MKKLLLLLSLAACRHAHLGPDVGVAYHIAIEAQEGSQAQRAPAFTATDAAGTMAARRTKPTGAAAVPAAVIAPMPAAGDASGGGAQWPGASGNISLEAK